MKIRLTPILDKLIQFLAVLLALAVGGALAKLIWRALRFGWRLL